MSYTRTDRKPEEFRNLKMTTGFISSADGSVLIEMGRTEPEGQGGGQGTQDVAEPPAEKRCSFADPGQGPSGNGKIQLSEVGFYGYSGFYSSSFVFFTASTKRSAAAFPASLRRRTMGPSIWSKPCMNPSWDEKSNSSGRGNGSGMLTTL